MAETYTYRKGKKVYLVKEQDQLVVRETPETRERMGFGGSKQQVSSHSKMRVVNSKHLDSTLEKIRKKAVGRGLF